MPTCLAAAMMPTFNSSLGAGDNEDSLSINVDLVDSQTLSRTLLLTIGKKIMNACLLAVTFLHKSLKQPQQTLTMAMTIR